MRSPNAILLANNTHIVGNTLVTFDSDGNGVILAAISTGGNWTLNAYWASYAYAYSGTQYPTLDLSNTGELTDGRAALTSVDGLMLRPGGAILIHGRDGDNVAYLEQFTSLGALDATFGDDDSGVMTLGDEDATVYAGLAIDGQGQILVSGNTAEDGFIHTELAGGGRVFIQQDANWNITPLPPHHSTSHTTG